MRSIPRPLTRLVATLLLVLVTTAGAQDLLVGKVTRVQDGDTVTLLDPEEKQHRIRLSGIDAPENSQPFGHDSRRYLSMLVLDKLASANCPKVDRYGRKVCTVWIGSIDASFAQLQAGFAWHYVRFAQEQPEHERNVYARAEELARVNRAGLWRDEHPLAPWDWRRQAARPPTR